MTFKDGFRLHKSFLLDCPRRYLATYAYCAASAGILDGRVALGSPASEMPVTRAPGDFSSLHANFSHSLTGYLRPLDMPSRRMTSMSFDDFDA